MYEVMKVENISTYKKFINKQKRIISDAVFKYQSNKL